MKPLAKWAYTEKKDTLHWAEKLKATKNPFLAPISPVQNGVRQVLPYSLFGAMASAGFNKLVTDKMASQWHIPMHSALAAVSTLLPSHPLSAAVGGAMFYAAISESIYKIIKSDLLKSVKDATKK